MAGVYAARMIRTTTLLVLCALSAVVAVAQGSRADYERADRLRRGWQDKTYRVRVQPTWFAEGTRFWYRNRLPGGTSEFIVVDASSGKRAPAFDHGRLAGVLAEMAGKTCEGSKLPFERIAFEDGMLSFNAFSRKWRCALADYTLTNVGAAPSERPNRRGRNERRNRGRRGRTGGGGTARSPDGRWRVRVQDHDLWVTEADSSEPRRLTNDGTEARPWAFLSWSPDSKTGLVCRVEPGAPGDLLNVETSKKHGEPATMRRRSYARPGDKMTTRELHLLKVEGWEQLAVEADLIDFRSVRVRWRADGGSFTYDKRDRGHQRDRVIEVNAATGKTRTIIDERSQTFIDHYHKAWSRYLDDTREILWASERDGWNHIYLYDASTGRVKNRVTTGQWLVRSVIDVDVTKRQLWFQACGVVPGEDPYHVHHMRVNFDGTGLVRLTDGDGTHSVSYSPDKKYIVDTYSRVDLPPVSELRRTSNGSLVCVLERAEISELEAAGWRPPEPFVAKGRDGQTDIWGIIVRPTNFDAAKRYPVIEYIYAGPHDSHVPKSFSAYRSIHAVAELGFVVVQIDGMGTNNRSKAFLDVCWKNIGDAGFPDRKLWIKAAAKKYPYLDTTKVGIYGTSAGGQNALGALLFHGDFYKAAVASCGCHDNRIDKASWNEQWMGYPVGPHYAEQSNVTQAGRLTGRLLLIVGELDTNVPPESTFQVVDALIKADKDFDLIVVPGAGHSSGGRYGERRRRDFFVRHLLGKEPRWEP